MQINVKSKQYSVTSEVQDYLEKRLSAIEKFLDESQSTAICDVELEHENAQQHGPVFRAEINLNVHGEFFRVEDSAESMTVAIDAVHEEILRQLRKGKTKHMSSIRKGGAKLKKMLRGEW